MRMITLAALATLAMTTSALAEGGDNPTRDLYTAPQPAMTRNYVDPAYTSSLRAERLPERRGPVAEDLREYQLHNPSR